MLPILILLLVDLILVCVAAALLIGLAITKRAAYAVLKRNFLGYFSNPTGYVFLCLFVLLTSMAAFWPHEFFNSNLANLDQLNFWFPVIMLFFIPAITMSIWADEKRQGTDELLLTLPADDFDIVIGKYMSAAAIYTVSLIFSQISTFLVLLFLSKGDLDVGLFFANYFGYWFIGLSMLAIGMIASFLTHNLTVGFILGSLFNAPLVFAAMSDVIIQRNAYAKLVSTFSIEDQFDSFGRGVISLAPVIFFSLVVAFGLYFCMVLIGRRHWSGGKDGNQMFLHYLARVLLFGSVVFTLSYFLRNNDFLRLDATEGKVSSLSPETLNLIRRLEPDRPIVIDAYISRDIPEQYSKTRYDLVTLLKEFQALASSRKIKLQVQINEDIEPSSEEAARAEKQYGITSQPVRVRERGAYKDQEVLLGAAVRSGLSKVVIPFFESGIPVEYELVRSITTVAQPSRIKLGIVRTDANFMGGFSMAGGGFQQIPKQPIVEELEKQYEVEEVDPSTPISSQYQVLFVVQPSSLNPDQLKNVVEAVKSGIPTAIFEDPMPAIYQGIPGTGEPKQSQQNMFGGGGGQEPKGDMTELWRLLGLEIPQQTTFTGIHPDIVWQKYNPHPKLQYLANANDEWLFVLESGGDDEDYLSEKSRITAGLRELMFLYAGGIQFDKDRDDLTYIPIVQTREDVSGRISYADVEAQNRMGETSAAQLQVLQGPPIGSQTLAAYIASASETQAGEKSATDKASAESSDDGKTGDGDASTSQSSESPGDAVTRPIRVVYVADVDYMHPFFSENRRRPEQFEDLDLRVQNITFVLNIVDVLAGEMPYPEIRSHEPKHVTLRLFEDQAERFRLEESANQKEYQESFEQTVKEAQEERDKVIAKTREKIEKLQREGTSSASKQQELIALLQQLEIQQATMDRKLQIRREKLEAELSAKIQESRRQAEAKILDLQAHYKMLAIFLPPIPPLLVGAGVFVTRRVREREGISKTRLR
ncbi:MAG: Gldg family protein [Planctomycetales bacterium]|nr:Gldg family protein [Planctomycetales bacterium]